MPSVLNGGYAPPGVYTQTFFGAPPTVPGVPPLVPLYIGTGSEILVQSNLPVVRGSSSSIDQQIVNEDESGRAVTNIAPSGLITLGAFDGTINRFQVKNFPLVSGDGSGTTATDTSAVSVTLNGEPVVVLGINGAKGIVEISEFPTATDVVLVTYFFDRTDTLVTDTVSAQVTPTAAILNGRTGQNFTFAAGTNQFKLSVDGLPEVVVSLPLATVAGSVVVATINGTAGIGSLVASTFVDNLGQTCVRLTADKSIVIGDGNANDVMGFVANEATSRNATFFVFNHPIVNGNGGGVTTTNPLDVKVMVDSVQVTPTAVNGRMGAVTLPFAPKRGSVVTIQYYFNSWQDTFDYLANTGVTAITRAGITATSNGAGLFIQGADYILKNDTIVWGTAVLVNTGLHTEGSTPFGGTQVTATLVDNQAFMAECARVVVNSGTVSTESKTQFQLPFQPTTGNGRNSPLGTTNYLIVANGRMDLPTDQPDLVVAYWGYSVQDAYERGPVTVTKVDSATSTITLAGEVPEGATVYATFYYNTLTDQAFIESSRGFTVTCASPGTSGAGTYSIINGLNSPVYGVTFLGKGAALNTIEVVFPSGSEFLSDARLENGTPTLETVTVEFASTDETPALFTAPGAGPYNTVAGQSSNLRVTIDGVAGTTGAAGGINLAFPSGSTRSGAFASIVGDEVPYTADSGETTYDLEAGVNDTVSVLVDGVSLTASVGTLVGATAQDFVDAINAAAIAGGAADPYIGSGGTFPSGFTVTLNEYDQLTFRYTGAILGSVGDITLGLTPGAYTAATLAAEINAQFLAFFTGLGPAFIGAAVTVTATADSGLRFQFSKATVDTSAFLEFVTGAVPARDFCVVAGICTDDAGKDGAKLCNGPIAALYTVTPVSGRTPYDRILLRNRIFPGGFSVAPFATLAQCSLQSQGGNGAALAGLPAGMAGEAAYTGCALGPTILGDTGWSGQVAAATFGDARDGQPSVTFYDGSDPSFPANNVFKLTVNGTLITVVFPASGSGTVTAVGPSTVAGSVIRALNTALAAAPGTVRAIQEGAKIRFYGSAAANLSGSAALIVGDGSANDTLGLTTGTVATATPVAAKQLASALRGHIAAADSTNWFLTPATSSAGYFSAKGLATSVVSSTGEEYLLLQSRTLGTASSFRFASATTNDALRTGSGLGIVSGDGSSGDPALNGFFVTSSDPASGSGSANTSVFNSGVGQDGFVGQTYVDDVTGLTFTVLPRAGGLSYPTGATATLSFRVSTNFVTDANIPTLAIPGLELTVANTVNVPAGDTALVETFKRGGSEPSIGEVYYVSYNYLKTDFSPKLFSRLSDVVNEYGPVSPDNPLSLAAYFAFLNGSSVIGCQQVPKTPGLSTASEAAYQAAIDLSAGASLPGFVSPSVLVPLTPATETLARYMAIHCDVQSSIRFKAERTALFGFASGTRTDQALAIAAAAGDTRVRFVYPDIASVSLTDVLGVTKTYLVDGRYPAAAVAAATTAPTIDPATPWESRQIIGFTALNRRLDTVTANQLAVGGVTVLENRPPFIRIRHGVTSDVTNILTRTPTVIQIADEIQKRVRSVCSPFIGAKFLPQILGQIEGRLSEMFKAAVAEQIITTFTGITVNVDPSDPTAIIVEAFYQPVWPLLYVQVTLRVSAQ